MCAIKSPEPQTAIGNGGGYIGRADCPGLFYLPMEEQVMAKRIRLEESEESCVSVKMRLSDAATMPEYKSDGAACMDLASTHSFYIRPHNYAYIHTGVSVELPKGSALMIYPRSSLHKKSLILANSVGVIDSDYRGEIVVCLYNTSYMSQKIDVGERIVQAMLIKVVPIQVDVVDMLTPTKRGEGGFGSTGA